MSVDSNSQFDYELVNLMKGKLLPDVFSPLNTEKIYEFADLFGQRPIVQKYLTTVNKRKHILYHSTQKWKFRL